MQTRSLSYIEPLPECRKKIKLSQLNHLLRIYHGLEIYDLNCKIRVDTSRVRNEELSASLSSDVLNGIEDLMISMQNAGIKNDHYIPDPYEKQLIELAKTGEKIDEEPPVKLLCKRIAAIMRLDMKSKVFFSTAIVKEAGTACLLTGLIRIGSEFYPELFLGYGILLIMASVMLFLKIEPSKFATIDDETIEYNGERFFKLNENRSRSHNLFSQKIQEYSVALELKAAPQLYLFDPHGKFPSRHASSIRPISTSTIAKNGIILLENNLSDTFDKEEICALIAHEMGHLKESSALKVALIIGIPMISGFSFRLLSMLTENIPAISGDINMISNWMLMFIAAILSVRQILISSEYNADKMAIKLTGPLAVSSTLRTIETDGRIECASLNQSEYPRLFSILKNLNMDDFISSHPSTLKRMQQAIF